MRPQQQQGQQGQRVLQKAVDTQGLSPRSLLLECKGRLRVQQQQQQQQQGSAARHKAPAVGKVRQQLAAAAVRGLRRCHLWQRQQWQQQQQLRRLVAALSRCRWEWRLSMLRPRQQYSRWV
jgi:hypothetical protein